MFTCYPVGSIKSTKSSFGFHQTLTLLHTPKLCPLTSVPSQLPGSQADGWKISSQVAHITEIILKLK